MSKGFLYSLAAIIGVSVLSFFIFSPSTTTIPILRFLGIIFLPVLCLVILISIFKHRNTNVKGVIVQKYSLLEIFLTTCKVVIIGSTIAPLIVVIHDIETLIPLKFDSESYALWIVLGTYFTVTIPSLLVYVVLYLVKKAQSKN